MRYLLAAALLAALLGALIGCALIFGKAGALGVAVAAGFVVVWYAAKAWRDDLREQNRRYRDEVWQRRVSARR